MKDNAGDASPAQVEDALTRRLKPLNSDKLLSVTHELARTLLARAVLPADSDAARVLQGLDVEIDPSDPSLSMVDRFRLIAQLDAISSRGVAGQSWPHRAAARRELERMRSATNERVAEAHPSVASSWSERRDLRLVILDDHRLFAESLASDLNSERGFGAVVLMDPLDVQGGFDRLVQLDPSILVLGVGAGLSAFGASDEQLVRDIESSVANVRTLMVGFAAEAHRFLDSLEAGVKGCVFREQPLHEIVTAIGEVIDGRSVVPPQIAGALFDRSVAFGWRRGRRTRLERLTLTPRELEVLRLTADGLSNEQIAQQLMISVHTVKNHIHRVLETLGVVRRWDAVRLAYHKGWLGHRGDESRRIWPRQS